MVKICTKVNFARHYLYISQKIITFATQKVNEAFGE